MKGEKSEDWVPFQRKIARDYRNRIITRDELSVFFWLRINANSFGISTTSLSDLSDDALRKQGKENYINKLLLSLKKKRYLYYPKRSGCRGSFEVHFADFFLPNGAISSLDKFFTTDLVRSDDVPDIINKSEPEQSLNPSSHNLDDIKSDINSIVDTFSINKPVRTYNNDNDKEKDNIYNWIYWLFT